ncbi:MAG: D-tyrosyl-tRNA(Tyr) deacylase [Bacteroidaceae bacterium]|nr:D-tyrosyl-tRNA(Tyr) deacylase [Bacteroidaceae bacterium]
MRVVIQRVSHASVKVEGIICGAIQEGLLVFIGIEEEDTQEDVDWLAQKIVNIRIFDDQNGVMNRSVIDENGGILVISQFTLMALTKKGNRPSYIKAAKHEISIPLYENFCKTISKLLKKPVEKGIFGADMKIELLNNGPVTIFIDSKKRE